MPTVISASLPPPSARILLAALSIRVPSGTPVLWVDRNDLRTYPFTQDNLAIIETLRFTGDAERR